jgi:hypothetical protein
VTVISVSIISNALVLASYHQHQGIGRNITSRL